MRYVYRFFYMQINEAFQPVAGCYAKDTANLLGTKGFHNHHKEDKVLKR